MYPSLAVAALVGVSVIIAGCGGSGTPAPTPAPTPVPTPAPTPPPADMNAVLAKYLVDVEEENFDAIASRCEFEADLGYFTEFEYSAIIPGTSVRGWIRDFWAPPKGSGRVDAPNLTYSILADVAAPVGTLPREDRVAKVGLALWHSTRGVFSRSLPLPIFVHDIVLFTAWGGIQSYRSHFIDKERARSPVNESSEEELEQSSEEGFAIKDPSSATTTTTISIVLNNDKIIAMRSKFYEAWKAKKRADFVDMFAEDAQVSIYDDCMETDNETDKVVGFQGRRGASEIFDRFLYRTIPIEPRSPDSPYSVMAVRTGTAGVFSHRVKCGPGVGSVRLNCHFTFTVVLAESETGELQIKFSLGSWGREDWPTEAEGSCAAPGQQRAAELQERLIV